MMKIFKRKKVDYRDYIPNSTLKVKETSIKQHEYGIVDAHIHLGPRYVGEKFYERYDIHQFVKMMKDSGVCHAVDLQLFSEQYLDEVQTIIKGYEDYFSFCAPINVENFQDNEFETQMVDYMHRMSQRANVCGFKVWKDLGMSIKNRQGKLVKLSDPQFDVIWKTAGELKRPIVIHVADPKAFFEEVNERNERFEELTCYPMWSYYGNVGHTDILKQFERVLEENKKTVFVAAHLISNASDLDYVGRMLENYPNLNVDIAAVLSEIGRQPITFRKFAEKFQGRIIFGTDTFGGDPSYYPYYYRFLETDDEYFEYRPNHDYSQGRWRIYGCNLSNDALERIYFKNAERIFNLARNTDEYPYTNA